MEMTEIESKDVIIIGGGPAGISAALWCHELGLKTLLFEENKELGGQLLWTYNRIDNYLGINAQNGKELRDIFLKHAAPRNLNFVIGSKVSSVDLAKKEIALGAGQRHTARTIIIAAGIRRRKLGLERENFFTGRGILESGKKDSELAAGKNVCVVGGGDAALENALIMAEKAASVTLIHRSDKFTARPEFLDKAKANEKIKILTNSRIKSLLGENMLNGVEIKHNLIGEKYVYPADYLLIRIGVEPNSQMFQGQIKMDEKGYINIDSNCQTSMENIFAIGDIANPVSPTIITAAGMGATAAKAILVNLKNGI